MSLEISIQPTPNPNAMKFTASQNLFEGTGSVSAKKGESTDYPLLNALLEIDGVDNVFGFQNFVTINKTSDAQWDNMLPNIEKAFE